MWLEESSWKEKRCDSELKVIYRNRGVQAIYEPQGEARRLTYRLITEAKVYNRLISSLVKFRKKY